MTYSALDTTAYAGQYLVDLEWEQGSNTYILALCSADSRGSAGSPETHDDARCPCIIRMGDICADDGGFIRGNIVLSQQQSISLVHDTGFFIQYIPKQTIAHAFATPGLRPEWATITIQYRYWGANVDDAIVETVAKGKVTAVTGIGEHSMTLEFEQRADVEFAEVPKHVVSTALAGHDLFHTLHDDADGSAIPFMLGRNVLYRPALVSGVTDASSRTAFASVGIVSAVTPALRMYDDDTYHSYAYEESVPDAPGRLPLSGDGRHAYVYLPMLEKYAQASLSVFGGALDEQEVTYLCALKHNPWVEVPIVPTGLHQTLKGNALDPEQAYDGRLDTYATVPATTGRLALPLPAISSLGRISTGADYEGDVNAPIGLTVKAIICRPSGTTNPTTNWARVGLAFPDSSYNTVLDQTNFLYTALQVSTGSYTELSVNLTYYSASTDCWMGTKFKDWDFTTTPTYDATHPDRIFYSGLLENHNEPLMLSIYNTTNQPLYVLGISLLVRCALGAAETRQYRPRPYSGFRIPSRKLRKFVERKYDEFQDYISAGTGPGNNRHGWDRGRGSRNQIDAQTDAIDSNVYVSHSGYRDETDGRYTGTAGAYIKRPGDQAKFILHVYGGVALTDFATSPARGAWSTGAGLYNTWATYAQESPTMYEVDALFTKQTSLRQALDYLAQHSPGMEIRRNREGKWTLNLWVPELGLLTGDLYKRGTATTYALRPLSDIVVSDQGLAFEINGGDVSSVINEINVEYDMDVATGKYKRTATCAASTSPYAVNSDDGYGDLWNAAAPGTGQTCEDLCTWSQAQYGGPRKTTISVPGIRRPKLAVLIGLYHIWRFYRPLPTLRMTCTEAMRDMEPGHVFRLSNDMQDDCGLLPMFWGATTWEQVYWRCTSAHRREDAARTVVIEAEWQPISIGDELAKGAGGSPTTDFDDVELLGV